MKWVRHIVVYLLSIILLISLLGASLATSSQVTLTHPTKIENWLNQSDIYPNLQQYIAQQAQTSITESVTGGSSIGSSVIQQAIQSSFSQTLLQQSVSQFISGNYSWLEGKTAAPNFKIDLSGPKTQFGTQVAQAAVLNHISSLAACTPAQTAQLQSANPLLLSCRPTGISLQTEVEFVGQQLSNGGGFLNNSVITANTIGSGNNNGGEPYFKKFAKVPKAYQLTQKLPWILIIVSFIAILGIIYADMKKRRGLRKVGIVVLISGLLLIIDKYVTNTVFNKVKGQAFSSINNGSLQQSLITFIHYIETEFVKINLWFGVGYVILALLILGTLLATRHRKPKPSSNTSKNAPNSSPSNGTSKTTALSGRLQRRSNTNNLDYNTPPTIPKNMKRPVTEPRKDRPRPPRPPKLIQ
jgi:hypothetical protein